MLIEPEDELANSALQTRDVTNNNHLKQQQEQIKKQILPNKVDKNEFASSDFLHIEGWQYDR